MPGSVAGQLRANPQAACTPPFAPRVSGTFGTLTTIAAPASLRAFSPELERT